MGGRTIQWLAGAYAAAAVLALWRARRRGGPGALVDLAVAEVANTGAANFMDLFHAIDRGAGAEPVAPPRAFETPSIERTADGWVGFNTNAPHQATAFLRMLGRDDLADRGEYTMASQRHAGFDEFQAMVTAWTSVRTTDVPFEVPEHLRDGEGALIYLSLGSLGSADVELMRRLVDVLSRTRHRFIVSKGPQAHLYELADNMWGEASVPQTNVIPLVDLVITHGGNNTTTESFHFGKPMIGLPLFWDQYDNAQRVEETGFGVRLDTYRFTEEELHGAIERLLGDTALRRRADELGVAVRARSGTRLAADLLERLVS